MPPPTKVERAARLKAGWRWCELGQHWARLFKFKRWRRSCIACEESAR